MLATLGRLAKMLFIYAGPRSLFVTKGRKRMPTFLGALYLIDCDDFYGNLVGIRAMSAYCRIYVPSHVLFECRS